MTSFRCVNDFEKAPIEVDGCSVRKAGITFDEWN
jgi:hypothetical protein